MSENKNYIPFGPEWQKEMSKWGKVELINLLREQLIENARAVRISKQMFEKFPDEMLKILEAEKAIQN